MQYKVFWCKVNKYYTDAWLSSEYLADKTGTFVASCVVTDSAKRKWVRFVKKELEHISWKQKIYISGCWAFKDGKAQDDFFDLYPELANSQDKIEVLDEAPSEIQENPSISSDTQLSSLSFQETQITPNPSLNKREEQKSWKIDIWKLEKLKTPWIYTKKFILIQGWCDSFCSFCLTVQKRGRHYYRSAEDIAQEIRDFESEWGKEVVLTGVNLSAWGLENTHDIKNFSSDIVKNGQSGQDQSRFAQLLRYILDNTSIPRIRISSLGPEFITDEVVEICSDERIYPHFHFSIQSWSTKILKSMARHYDGIYMKKLLEKFHNIRRDDWVDISIWADIIVGFPWESDDDFLETYNLVKQYKISKLHAFPFSAHTLWESVPAGKFTQQIPQHIKKERMQRLMKLWDEIREDFKKSQKWKTLKVLVEKNNGKKWSGWSENYIEADETNFKILSGIPKRNSIITGKFI